MLDEEDYTEEGGGQKNSSKTCALSQKGLKKRSPGTLFGMGVADGNPRFRDSAV